jgi:hypothetical protein
LNHNISIPLLNLIQTILAVLVLVYSILLSQENFYTRAEGMLRNGIELDRFVRKIEGIITEDDQQSNYSNLTKEYYDILEKYENHETVDFIFAKLQIKPKDKIQYLNYYCNKINAYARTLYVVLLYIFPFVFVLSALFYIIY